MKCHKIPLLSARVSEIFPTQDRGLRHLRRGARRTAEWRPEAAHRHREGLGTEAAGGVRGWVVMWALWECRKIASSMDSEMKMMLDDGNNYIYCKRMEYTLEGLDGIRMVILLLPSG